MEIQKMMKKKIKEYFWNIPSLVYIVLWASQENQENLQPLVHIDWVHPRRNRGVHGPKPRQLPHKCQGS